MAQKQLTCWFCGTPILADATQRRGYRHDIDSTLVNGKFKHPIPANTLKAGCLTMACPSAMTPDSIPFGPWPYRVIVALLCIALLGSTGCTADNEAQRVLRSQGYTYVELTGYRFFKCSDDDTFHTGFRARTHSGSTVTGTVCSGVVKGATIRLD